MDVGKSIAEKESQRVVSIVPRLQHQPSLMHSVLNSNGRWPGMSQHSVVCPGCSSVCQCNYRQ